MSKALRSFPKVKCVGGEKLSKKLYHTVLCSFWLNKACSFGNEWCSVRSWGWVQSSLVIQGWFPWVNSDTSYHFESLTRVFLLVQWQPNPENAFAAGTAVGLSALARDVLSVVLGTVQLVQDEHEHEPKLHFNNESSWGPRGSCCPLGGPGVLSVPPGWCRMSLAGFCIFSAPQVWNPHPGVRNEVFCCLCSQRGIRERSQSIAHSGCRIQPSLSIQRSQGWCNGRVRPGSWAKDRFWKLNPVRQQILQKYVSAVHARFWLITTNQVKLSCNPSELQSRTGSPSLLSLPWISTCKPSRPSLASSALLMSALLPSLFYLNVVGFQSWKRHSRDSLVEHNVDNYLTKNVPGRYI